MIKSKGKIQYLNHLRKGIKKLTKQERSTKGNIKSAITEKLMKTMNKQRHKLQTIKGKAAKEKRDNIKDWKHYKCLIKL